MIAELFLYTLIFCAIVGALAYVVTLALLAKYWG